MIKFKVIQPYSEELALAQHAREVAERERDLRRQVVQSEIHTVRNKFGIDVSKMTAKQAFAAGQKFAEDVKNNPYKYAAWLKSKEDEPF